MFPLSQAAHNPDKHIGRSEKPLQTYDSNQVFPIDALIVRLH